MEITAKQIKKYSKYTVPQLTNDKMETNLEKAKRLVYDHAYAGGIELPEDGFLFKMLELAATPDPSNPINNKLNKAPVMPSVCNNPRG